MPVFDWLSVCEKMPFESIVVELFGRIAGIVGLLFIIPELICSWLPTSHQVFLEADGCEVIDQASCFISVIGW